MQFNAILSKLCPAIGGKEYVMFIAIYTYLSRTTPERDRMLRITWFAAFTQILPPLFYPLSGFLFKLFKYQRKWRRCAFLENQNKCRLNSFSAIFIACIIINALGIVYLAVGLNDEDQETIELGEAASDANLAEEETDDEQEQEKDGNPDKKEKKKRKKAKPSTFKTLVDFYKLLIRKRRFNARRALIHVFILYFICSAPGFGKWRWKWKSILL